MCCLIILRGENRTAVFYLIRICLCPNNDLQYFNKQEGDVIAYSDITTSTS